MDLRKKSHEIGSIKYGPDIKYLLNMVQYVKHFACKYLKRNFKKKKNHFILLLPNILLVLSILFIEHGPIGDLWKKSHKITSVSMLLRCAIFLTRTNKWYSKLLKTDLWKKSHEIFYKIWYCCIQRCIYELVKHLW